MISPKWILGNEYDMMESRQDKTYGAFQVVRFPQIDRKNQIYARKTMHPNQMDRLQFSSKALQKRVTTHFPKVSRFDCIGESTSQPGHYDLYFGFDKGTLLEVFQQRVISEGEIWRVVDTICSVGTSFEKHLEHFPYLNKAAILLGENGVGILNPYLSESYLQFVVTYYLPGDQNAFAQHHENIRRNLREFGIVLLSLASNTPQYEIKSRQKVSSLIQALKSQRLTSFATLSEILILTQQIQSFEELHRFAGSLRQAAQPHSESEQQQQQQQPQQGRNSVMRNSISLIGGTRNRDPNQGQGPTGLNNSQNNFNSSQKQQNTQGGQKPRRNKIFEDNVPAPGPIPSMDLPKPSPSKPKVWEKLPTSMQSTYNQPNQIQNMSPAPPAYQPDESPSMVQPSGNSKQFGKKSLPPSLHQGDVDEVEPPNIDFDEQPTLVESPVIAEHKIANKMGLSEEQVHQPESNLTQNINPKQDQNNNQQAPQQQHPEMISEDQESQNNRNNSASQKNRFDITKCTKKIAK